MWFRNVLQGSICLRKVTHGSEMFSTVLFVHLKFPRFSTVFQGSLRFKVHWGSLRFAKAHQSALMFAQVRRISPRFAKVCWDSPKIAEVRRGPPSFSQTCLRSLRCAKVRQGSLKFVTVR